MLLFLISLLPLFLIGYCLKVRTQKVVPVIFTGAFTAVIVCAWKMLFVLSHRIIPYSFSQNFVYFLVKETLIPAVILYAIYFLISKDNVEFKINTYLPLELSFYSVYLPYCVISSTSSAYSGFSIFIKPMIFAMMIAETGVALRDIYRGVTANKKGDVVLNIILILFFMAMPPVIEAIYSLNYSLWILWGSSAVYLILPAVLYLLNKRKK